MRQARYGSAMWKVQQEMQAAEAARPKSSTNWSSPVTNIISGMNLLRGALAAGENAKLEKIWNEDAAYPIRVNRNLPWKEQVSKKFKHKVWVVVLYYNHKKFKAPFMVHVLNVLAYPLKFIPRRSVLQMEEYKCVSYRVGDVIHGFTVEFHIPKKFAFSKR